jgi:endonuclease-8
VLLDQRVAAGIGNVYKSELLWLHRLAPSTPLGSLDPAGRRALYADAARLLRANLGPGARVTVPGVPGGLAVYGRGGRTCPRCRDTVRRATLGTPPRGTWWCPGCQHEPDVDPGTGMPVGTPVAGGPERPS